MRTVLLFITLLIATVGLPQSDGMDRREATARRLLANNKPYRAISLLNGAIDREDRPVFHALRADAYNRIGVYNKAHADARTALVGLPGDPDLLLQLAISEQGLGQADSAEAHYQRVLVVKPGSDTRYRLATALQAGRKPAAALAQLDEVFAGLSNDDPERAKVLRSKAECLALTGDTAAARTTFAQALELAPNDPVILNSRGWYLYTANGDHARAVADFSKAIK
ncbi:MAG TPA: tetratricopeptide repeat protein, partial [Flavobacteriales bacterium]|nr:tetratricopeptide repeat protein [Flavobacteriales bacterium]